MSDPRISVVIRAYNEENHIGRLLHGIKRQTVADPEVILVDSGSTDDTVSIARRFSAQVHHIEPEAFTFGRALNLGCSRASGEFLVFASAHVYPVFEDWLATLIAPFEDERIGAVYGKQRGGETTQYSERRIFARLYPDQAVPVQDSPFCNNANCAIRRELWQKEPYNEQLTGLEDLDWARRVMERGYRISYAAGAEVVHVHDESPSEVKHRHMREAIALKEIFPEQGMSALEGLVLFVKNSVADLVHATRDGQLFENLLAIPRFRLMQFWGAYRGFQQHGPVPARLRRRFYYPAGVPEESREVPEKRSEEQRIDYQEHELGAG